MDTLGQGMSNKRKDGTIFGRQFGEIVKTLIFGLD